MAQKGVVQIQSKRTHRIPQGWIDQFSNLKEVDPKLVIEKELPSRIISATIDLGEFSSEEEFNQQVEKISPGRNLRILGGRFGVVIKNGKYVPLHDAIIPLNNLSNVYNLVGSNSSEVHLINRRASRAISEYYKFLSSQPSIQEAFTLAYKRECDEPKWFLSDTFRSLRSLLMLIEMFLGNDQMIFEKTPENDQVIKEFGNVTAYWREFNAENIHEYDF